MGSLGDLQAMVVGKCPEEGVLKLAIGEFELPPPIALIRGPFETLRTSTPLFPRRLPSRALRKCCLWKPKDGRPQAHAHRRLVDLPDGHRDDHDYVKLLNGLGSNPPSNSWALLARKRITAPVGTTTLRRLTELLEAKTGRQIDAALTRVRDSRDLDSDLLPVLDIAIDMTGADMGNLQRFDESADCLTFVASRGFSSEALSFFGVVRRDTNSTCAAALTRRMRVFVEDVSTSYLFVGTRELDVLRAEGVAAVQSTPLISSNGRLWGVLSTHFHEAQTESAFDHTAFDRFAVQIADSLEQRDAVMASQDKAGISDGGN
jgi:hypothetical protein